MPDLEDLLGEAADGRERSLATLTPRAEQLAATVSRVRRRRALRRGVQVAAVVPVAAALGLGAWALAGRPAPEPVATPTTTTSSAPAPSPSPSPTPMATPSPTPTPTAAPSPTEPPLTDAITTSNTHDEEWFRMGGLVPLDAPFATFPTTSAHAREETDCTPEQHAWLETYGTADSERTDTAGMVPAVASSSAPYVPLRWYTLTNTSDSAVTIQNLRVEGTWSPRPAGRVWVGCITGGIGGSAEPRYEVAVPGSTTPAMFATYANGEDLFPGEALPLNKAGTPFMTTVAPGDSYQLSLLLDTAETDREFHGRVIADVVIDGTTYRTVIDPDLYQLAQQDASLYVAAGYDGLACFPDRDTAEDARSVSFESARPYECTPADLAAKAVALRGQ